MLQLKSCNIKKRFCTTLIIIMTTSPTNCCCSYLIILYNVINYITRPKKQTSMIETRTFKVVFLKSDAKNTRTSRKRVCNITNNTN